jgi:hypothetical protein
MATARSSSAPLGAKPHDTDPATPTPARPVDAPQCPTAPTPGEASDAPADEHTHETIIPGEGPRPPRPRLDFADLAAISAWLEDLAVHVQDLGDAAEDQTAPMAERTLGRARARDLIGAARKRIAQSIAYARAGLPAAGGAA